MKNEIAQDISDTLELMLSYI
ncbi:hypothetical protein LCGC14_2150290, partial [marine sediment metagenome]